MAAKFDFTNSRGFTLIELMITLAMITILAGTAGPMFLNYATRAKTSEAMIGLNKMTEGEVSIFTRSGNFLEAGPANIPPSSNKVIVDFDTDPNWKTINFGFDGPIYFGYQAVANGTNAIDCEALGDLDGDTVLSTFRRSVQSQNGGTPQAGGVFVFDELE